MKTDAMKRIGVLLLGLCLFALGCEDGKKRVVPFHLSSSSASTSSSTGAGSSSGASNGSTGTSTSNPSNSTGTSNGSSGGTTSGASSLPAGTLRRVVLALDGVPYEAMADLQSQGHFQQFEPVSRMVSIFPSLSNPAWASVLRLGREPGYQTYYFSNRQKEKVGMSLGDMSNPPFGSRFHIAPDGVIEHALSYVFTYSTARKVLKETIEKIINMKGRETVFAYSSHTDALTHSDGRAKLFKLLKKLDEFLTDLQARYKKKHPGHELEIVLLSDHGNTLKKGGKLVNVEKAVKRAGLQISDELESKKDVAYTSGGILSIVALHTHPDNEAKLARSMAKMVGCDFACYDKNGTQYIRSTRGTAKLEWDATGTRAKYTVTSGSDPLKLQGVLSRLKAAGKVDANGFVSGEDVFDETYDADYPDPFRRIRDGLTDLVDSPSNVLVSLKTGYENANGFVKFMAKLKGRAGTHGALGQKDTCGIFMSTKTRYPAAVRAQEVGDHVDLTPLHEHISEMLLTIDPSGDKRAFVNPNYSVSFLFRDGLSKVANKFGSTSYHVQVRQKRLFIDKILYAEDFQPSSVLKTDDIAEIDLSSVLSKMKAGKKYQVRARIEMLGSGQTQTIKRKFKRTKDIQLVD